MSANDRRPSCCSSARILRSRSLRRSICCHRAKRYALAWLRRATARAYPCTMFEEAQLYAPVTEGPDGVKVHLADDHPGANDPEYRRRRNEIAAAALAWEPGAAGPARRLHRRGARDLAHGLARARPEARAARVPRVPRGEGRARAARGPRPAARRGHRAARAADRLQVPSGRRPRPARRVLRLARRPRLPLDAVPAPPERAALHARAGHRARGDRPREPARRPGHRRGQAARGRGRAPLRDAGGRCSTSPTSSGSRSSSA